MADFTDDPDQRERRRKAMVDFLDFANDAGYGDLYFRLQYREENHRCFLDIDWLGNIDQEGVQLLATAARMSMGGTPLNTTFRFNL
jgi:hypothetical protein